MTASPEPKADAAAEARPEGQGLPPTTDRGISPIAGRFGGRGSKVVTLAALGLGCAVFLFATWDRGEGDDRKAAADEPARQVVPFEPARRDAEPPLLTDQPLDPEAPVLTSSGEQVPALETSPSPASNGPSAAERRQTLTDEARRSPVLAYSVQGASDLQPSEVTDNGRFTVLRFPANQPLPSIFAVSADGEESLVPFDVRGEFVVIHAVVPGLRLRRGQSVLCIFNEAYDPRGVAFGTGTASPIVDRSVTQGAQP